MSETQTQQPRTARTAEGSEFKKLLEKSGREVEFVPFGASDKLRLNVSMVQNHIAIKTRSGRTCSESDAIKFIMLCQAQRLNPFAGDAYMTGYDGKDGSPKFSLITAVQVFYKRAETCADYEGLDSGIILRGEGGTTVEREGDFCLPDEEVVGGWAIVYRKGRRPLKAKLSIEATRPPYETPFWNKQKAPGQISKCAEADVLRRSFPSLLGGLYIDSEFSEFANRIVADAGTKAAEIRGSALVEVVPREPAPAAPPERTAEDRDQEEAEEMASGLAPAKPAEATKGQQTASDELSMFITGEGFTFQQFQRWATGSGNVPDADSIADFSQVPADVAKRLLRAKAGLLKGLAVAKAEMEGK
jgi:phage recombination protein Bet